MKVRYTSSLDMSIIFLTRFCFFWSLLDEDSIAALLLLVLPLVSLVFFEDAGSCCDDFFRGFGCDFFFVRLSFSCSSSFSELDPTGEASLRTVLLGRSTFDAFFFLFFL